MWWRERARQPSRGGGKPENLRENNTQREASRAGWVRVVKLLKSIQGEPRTSQKAGGKRCWEKIAEINEDRLCQAPAGVGR